MPRASARLGLGEEVESALNPSLCFSHRLWLPRDSARLGLGEEVEMELGPKTFAAATSWDALQLANAAGKPADCAYSFYDYLAQCFPSLQTSKRKILETAFQRVQLDEMIELMRFSCGATPSHTPARKDDLAVVSLLACLHILVDAASHVQLNTYFIFIIYI